MNKLFRVVCQFFMLLTLSSFSHAGSYLGFGFGMLDYAQPNVESATLPDSDNPQVIVRQIDGGKRPERFRDLDDNLSGLKVKFGYQITDFFALELRGGFGVSPIKLTDYGEEVITAALTLPIPPPDNRAIEIITTPVDAELSLKNYFGGYIRLGGDFPNSVVSPYILVGHTRGDFAVTETTGEAGGKLRDSSYGAGLNIRLNEQLYINMEYMQMFDRKEIEVQEFTIGIEYKL